MRFDENIVWAEQIQATAWPDEYVLLFLFHVGGPEYDFGSFRNSDGFLTILIKINHRQNFKILAVLKAF